MRENYDLSKLTKIVEFVFFFLSSDVWGTGSCGPPASVLCFYAPAEGALLPES